MSDVLLFQTNDNGDINIDGGIIELTGGFDTAFYLSLFGGNWLDDGSQDNENQWWGNYIETNPSNRYRSETQYLLGLLPATTGNLKRIEDAAGRDLEWMLTENAASSVEVEASLVGLNRIQITITVEADGQEQQFNFTQNWRAGAQ